MVDLFDGEGLEMDHIQRHLILKKLSGGGGNGDDSNGCLVFFVGLIIFFSGVFFLVFTTGAIAFQYEDVKPSQWGWWIGSAAVLLVVYVLMGSGVTGGISTLTSLVLVASFLALLTANSDSGRRSPWVAGTCLVVSAAFLIFRRKIYRKAHEFVTDRFGVGNPAEVIFGEDHMRLL